MDQDHVTRLIKEVVERTMSVLGVEHRADVVSENRDGKTVLTVSIQAPEHGRLLIGKNGQNLHALEQVLKAVAAKDATGASLVSVDVNDYKKSRAERVIQIAREVVARVRATRRAEALMPMSSYERRIVHTELAAMSDIATESVGQEPQRRIVIKTVASSLN
ncbi:MAG TPA: R3H domain-containing nucleic acid-binding protein [Candidatus Paceibacterota bacterium]|nr:R3H domain-containing nucleic acid-binding protein [Candidatus Paceibacterota bacterium]